MSNRISKSPYLQRRLLKSIFLFLFLLGSYRNLAADVPPVTQFKKVTIVFDASECKLDSIAANLLADDIQRVSGYRPAVFTRLADTKGEVIIIGSVRSKLISSLKQADIEARLRNKWECYELKTLSHPAKHIDQALVIAGSDFRGTAYGVFEISKRIGVTPWYWWADAKPMFKKELTLRITDTLSAEPSVKFRGIFINDEDWGLQPWAAKTLEPETGDIGPKTYAKVFELLLRLNANLIWPAMHPSTKAFYHYPGNIQTAADYQIVIGSSHAEPMLRNNVSEWNQKTMGAFNYVTNQQQVDNYWETRIQESSHMNAIYSMGMRGIHDSGIEGVKTPQETVPLLERIFANQREMLKKYINPDITKVPQAFTAYKEVLDVYDAGLKVPDDITIVWPDDNYGYIQRLDDEKENRRSGGSGVYYHVSYWGRPHDYIWLCSTAPGLIREEMTKAYDMNDRQLWVVNVGDIKPAEYDIQFFLDMAYRIQPFYNNNYPKTHLKDWVSKNIDAKNAGAIADVMDNYYQLAFERKPEFMGWSQTEPNTPVHFTAYNHQYYGDQAQKRIDDYSRLEQSAEILKAKIKPDRQDSYYQLVYYPVVSTSLMNKKFIYRDKAYLYAKQGRISASYYDSLAKAAYQGIISQTDYYNTKLSAGKWAHIIAMNPRNLAVYRAPELNYKIADRSGTWQVLPEGITDTTGNDALVLPEFNDTREKHFIDVFLTKETALSYDIKTSAPWIGVSQQKGNLNPKDGRSQNRLWVAIDWTKIPRKREANGTITIQGPGNHFSIAVKAIKNKEPGRKDGQGFIENNGYISIYAKNYQSKTKSGENYWREISGLGGTGITLEALPLKILAPAKTDLSDAGIKRNATVSYQFYTSSKNSDANLEIFTIPTYPINRNFEMRYAVSVDNGPATVLNFKTTGRSEEWKQAVLSNSIMRNVKLPALTAGEHTLHIYLIDPGVILDRMLIDMGGLRPFYGLIPETKVSAQLNIKK